MECDHTLSLYDSLYRNGENEGIKKKGTDSMSEIETQTADICLHMLSPIFKTNG